MRLRLLPSLLAFAVASTLRAGDLPTVSSPLPVASAIVGTGIQSIDLRNYFAVTGITGQVVQFTTPGVGTFNVEMNTAAAPITVNNFLSYVAAGSFTNSIIHRSDKSLGIIQGGGFLNNASLSAITTNAPINMETTDALPNIIGSIAMARTGDPNSATSGWFINVANNSAINPNTGAAILPAANSTDGSGNPNGYAVFGRVTGTGMSVVNAIAGLPVLGGNVNVTGSSITSALVTVDTASTPSNFGPGWLLLGSQVTNVTGSFVTLAGNASTSITTTTPVPFTLFASPFDQLPVFTNLASAGNGSVSLSNLVTESTIAAVPVFPSTAGQASVVSFSGSNSMPTVAGASLNGSILAFQPSAGTTGVTTVSVVATDSNGNAATNNLLLFVTNADGTFHHPAFGWLFSAGNGWANSAAYGWMWFNANTPWIWSTSLQGWVSPVDPNSGTVWSAQFGWLTPSPSNPYVATTSKIGAVYVGQYNGAGISNGWVVSPQYGYVWAAGDGVWFYSNNYGWLGVTAGGGIWSVNQGRFL